MDANSQTDGDAHIDAASHLVSPANWAAIAGSWSFEGEVCRYHGPVDAATPTPFGLALCNERMRDGRSRVKIEFTELKNCSAGLVLGYESQDTSYLIPQLGGYASAYAIAEFVPGVGWRSLLMAGSLKNLETTRGYLLEVEQVGQRITMAVDHVQIFQHILARPLPGNQLGLFAFGNSPVRFYDVSILQTQPRAFVAMQFGEPYDTIYREVIRPEAKRLGFHVIRIDEVSKPGIIFEDIKREIAEAKVVIAEITSANQNVFYELGYAHALNKPTILLAQRGRELPFDIRSYRVIFYEDSIGGKPLVEKNLQKHLHSILKDL
jgi:hypothetical protein